MDEQSLDCKNNSSAINSISNTHAPRHDNSTPLRVSKTSKLTSKAKVAALEIDTLQIFLINPYTST